MSNTDGDCDPDSDPDTGVSVSGNEQISVNFRAMPVEADQEYLRGQGIRLEELPYLAERDLAGAVEGETIGAGTDRRERDRTDPGVPGQGE